MGNLQLNLLCFFKQRDESRRNFAQVAEYTDGAFVAFPDTVSRPLLNVDPPAPRKKPMGALVNLVRESELESLSAP